MIEVAAHRAEWATDFVAETNRLRDVFGERVRTINHIGSTAVPVLAAKPVIDMFVISSVPTFWDESGASG